jgi:hypothetical protein
VDVVIPSPPCGRGISLRKPRSDRGEIPRRPDQIGTPRNDRLDGFFSILLNKNPRRRLANPQGFPAHGEYSRPNPHSERNDLSFTSRKASRTRLPPLVIVSPLFSSPGHEAPATCHRTPETCPSDSCTSRHGERLVALDTDTGLGAVSRIESTPDTLQGGLLW